MVRYCSAHSCNTKSQNGVSLFGFPKDEEIRKKWIIAIKRYDWEPSTNSYLCEKHFKAEDFGTSGWSSVKKLKVEAVPSMFTFPVDFIEEELNRPKPIVTTAESISSDPEVDEESVSEFYCDEIRCKEEVENRSEPSPSDAIDNQSNVLNSADHPIKVTFSCRHKEAVDNIVSEPSLTEAIDKSPNVCISSNTSEERNYFPNVKSLNSSLNPVKSVGFKKVRSEKTVKDMPELSPNEPICIAFSVLTSADSTKMKNSVPNEIRRNSPCDNRKVDCNVVRHEEAVGNTSESPPNKTTDAAPNDFTTVYTPLIVNNKKSKPDRCKRKKRLFYVGDFECKDDNWALKLAKRKLVEKNSKLKVQHVQISRLHKTISDLEDLVHNLKEKVAATDLREKVFAVNAAKAAIYSLMHQNCEENDDGTNENNSGMQNTQPTASRSPLTEPARTLQPIAKKINLHGSIARQNELLQQACSCLENSANISKEPAIPTIAKAWGEKLLHLEPQQRTLAEKAINDVLYEASMDTLNRHSVKINEETFACGASNTLSSPVDNCGTLHRPTSRRAEYIDGEITHARTEKKICH